jgi:transcriptional regulator with XRE-family HTH domain
MDNRQATRLGKYLRQQRTAAGLSTHEVAKRAGFNQTTVVRLEQGGYVTPDPDKLQSLAVALGIDPAEVLERAGQAVPTDLLTPTTYLRTKYRDLPAADLERLTSDVERVLKRHGITPTRGPLPGEDELPEPTPPKKSRKPKGGTP